MRPSWNRASFLLFAALLASTPPASGERPTIKTFTSEQGLVSNSGIFSIQQDAEGYLWFGTHDGLSRFDGVSFRNYGPGQGLSGTAQISSLIVTSKDDLLTGATSARYDPRGDPAHRFREFTLPNHVRPLFYAEDHDGTVWTLGGALYRKPAASSKTSFERVCLSGKDACDDDPELAGGATLAVDRVNSLWIGTTSGELLRRSSSGAVQRFGVREGLTSRILTLLADREGGIWVGTSTDLVRLTVDPVPGRSIVAEDLASRGFPPCAVFALQQTRDGHIWAGTRCGLVELTGDHLQTYTVADGLSQNIIGSIFEDREGELWLGTESAGVMRMERKGITTFGPESNLEQDAIDGVSVDRAGRPVVISNQNGRLLLRVKEHETFRPLLPPLPLQPTDRGVQHWQIALEDHNGLWWIPGTNVIRIFAPGHGTTSTPLHLVRSVGRKEGLPRGRIDCMLEDFEGNIWFGLYTSANGDLVEWIRSTNTFRSWENAPGVPPHTVPIALRETRSGSIWVSYRMGALGRFRNGSHRLFVPAPGSSKVFLDLHEDDVGRLWTGNRVGDFYQIEHPDADQPTWRKINGIHTPFLRCILNDAAGRLYLGSESGLLQYDPASSEVRRFTERDGLPSDVVQNGVRDLNGVLWFGTGRGLMRFEPHALPAEAPPRVWLNNLEIGGRPYPGVSDRGEDSVSGVTFQEQDGSLLISFHPVRFHSDVQFQYRLTPGDAEWSSLTTDRSVTYPQLRSNRYRFEVRSVLADTTAGQPAVFTFQVLPPFWRRPWFLALMAIVLGAMLTIAYQYRIAQLLRVERLRLSIASDLHDDLGATLTQMALLSDQLYREQGTRDKVSEGLAKLADSAREMTQALADVVWSIRPERELSTDLLIRMRRIGNDLCGTHGVEFSLHVSENFSAAGLDAQIRRNLLLMYKEALRNAIRHSGCQSFKASLASEKRSIKMILSDDGHGFDPDDTPTGYGLLSLKRRAESLSGTAYVYSGTGSGTTICVMINVPKPFF